MFLGSASRSSPFYHLDVYCLYYFIQHNAALKSVGAISMSSSLEVMPPAPPPPFQGRRQILEFGEGSFSGGESERGGSIPFC